jgi:hypothetical protein
VTLTRPIGVWERVTAVFRGWVQRDGAVARGRETAESKPAKTPAR